MNENSRSARPQTTPLHALHVSLGAKMVPFAGYEMPVQYKTGIIKEHLHTRAAAGLFDVSHMGQAFLDGGPPPVYVGFGSMRTPGDIALVAIEAIRAQGRRVLLGRG